MDLDAGQTVPLDEEFLDTVQRNGRDFQKYAVENGVYFEPVDEYEIDRQAVAHDVLSKAFDGRLIFPPLTAPRRVLDCGFGAAHWAAEVAEKHPNCQVIGIDISPHMIPEDRPTNLDLQVDDLNKRFTFRSNTFDLVHSQMVAGGIHASRWREYMQDIQRVLRPGGWCQMVEIYFNAQSDNGTLTSDHALMRWSSRYLRSMHPRKDPRAPRQLEQLMRSLGFIEVQSRQMNLPMCGWPSDPREREIGEANKDHVHQLLSSMAVYPFTEFLDMSITDIQLLVAQARSEAEDPQYKAYFPLYVCIGRKQR